MSTAVLTSPRRVRPATGSTASGRPQWLTVLVQLARFAGIGAIGMGVYIGLFVAGQHVMSSAVANVVAWVVSTVATNRVHRAVTFGVHGREGVAVDQTISLLTSLAALGGSTLLLAAFPSSGLLTGVIILVAVNVLVGAVRFAIMRWWLVDHRLAHSA